MPEPNLLKPALLRRGDTVGIVAPAWTFDPNNFRRGVEKLQSLGYRVKYDRSIFSKYWSFAGHDKARAKQITRMFADRSVRAIFCAKAGYGSIRTIPYLDVEVIRNNPKIFVGYSDITILLAYLRHVAGMVVFHGPVVSGEVHEHMNPLTLEYLFRAIGQVQPLGKLRFSGMRRIRQGKASGLLVGGNLSMLISSIGTPYEIDTRDAILFLEDVGESIESLDNYLMHLKLAGKLSEIRGLLMGKLMDRIDYSGKKYNFPHMIDDIFEDRDLPILYGFPSGHRGSAELNVTLPLGIRVTLDADNRCVYLEEPAVS